MSKRLCNNNITKFNKEAHSMPHGKRKRIRHKQLNTITNETYSWSFSVNLAMIIASYLIFGHLEGDIFIKLLTFTMIIISHIKITLEASNEN